MEEKLLDIQNANLRLECIKLATTIVASMNHKGDMTALTVKDNIKRIALEISTDIGMKPFKEKV